MILTSEVNEILKIKKIRRIQMRIEKLIDKQQKRTKNYTRY